MIRPAGVERATHVKGRPRRIEGEVMNRMMPSSDRTCQQTTLSGVPSRITRWVDRPDNLVFLTRSRPEVTFAAFAGEVSPQTLENRKTTVLHHY